ncbi:energy transducer TonB [Geomonas sp.]|uniref:energy transducer TonB n=1 Tax=Geomonas sp. TaxID=2651584 RepID=UPI002B466D6E|nr:TonB C-terminal domain-containing protein [Geomonas sp.]HJV36925.1 TonB C-terminal domain-containing protein [Geomonas sp.]
MTRQLENRYPGPGGMFTLSFLLHLVIFAIILKGPFLPSSHPEEAPVYVDMVTLPVANPQSGMPSPSTSTEAAPAAPAAPPAAPKPPPPKQAEMVQPAPKPKAKTPAPKAKSEATKTAPSPSADEARAYQERMAKLQQKADEQRQAEVLNRLRNGSSRTGMPGGKGNQAGSDYTSYVRSRIQDAIDTLGAPTKASAQMAMVTITIGADGRITEYHLDRKSGDPLFDDAVARGVTLAGKTLKPPPDGRQYRHQFSFKPQ